MTLDVLLTILGFAALTFGGYKLILNIRSRSLKKVNSHNTTYITNHTHYHYYSSSKEDK